MKIGSTFLWICGFALFFVLQSCHKSFDTPSAHSQDQTDWNESVTLRAQNDGIPKGIKYFDKDYKGDDPNKLCRDWGGNCLETVIVYGRPSDTVMTTLDSLLSTIQNEGDITSFILEHIDIFSNYLHPPYLHSAELGNFTIKNHLLYTNGLISINFYNQNDSLIIAYPFANGEL